MADSVLTLGELIQPMVADVPTLLAEAMKRGDEISREMRIFTLTIWVSYISRERALPHSTYERSLLRLSKIYRTVLNINDRGVSKLRFKRGRYSSQC